MAHVSTIQGLFAVSASAGQEAPRLVVALLIIFVTAGVVATLFRRLKLEAIPGYIVGGALVGPNAIGLIDADAAAQVEQIANLAIILLMFGIGLMLDTGSLKRGMVPILALGAVSTVAVVLLAWPATLLFGTAAPTALVVAMAVSMSSTAVLLRVLQDRRELRTVYGRICLGTSIVQDLSSVLLLAALPAIARWAGVGKSAEAATQGGAQWQYLIQAASIGVGGILGIILIGRYVLPRVLRVVASVGGGASHELVLVLSGGIALGAALATGALGFSPEMGAFLAGFMLAFTPFKNQLAGQLAPLRDLLMAVFFTAVGIALKPAAIAQDWGMVLAGLVTLLVMKSAVIALCAWVMGATAPVAVLSGVYLCHAGEFSLVVIAAANAAGLPLRGDGATIIAVIVLSLVVAPLFVSSAHRWAARLTRVPQASWVRHSALHEAHDHDPHHGRPQRHVVVAGYGPVGRNIADRFTAMNVPVTIVELNPKTVQRQAKLGRAVVFGDITNPEVLEAAGVREAEAVILSIPDEEAMVRAVHAIRLLSPSVFIAARTSFLSKAIQAEQAGADTVTVEEMATADAMADNVIRNLENRRRATAAESSAG